MPKLSIIVTVYNLEKYVNKCLESLEWFFNKKDFEIIIIVDNPMDKSIKIVKPFLEKGNNVFLFIKPHGGASSAKNYGLIKSTGELLWFVDGSDSVLNPELLQSQLSDYSNWDILEFRYKCFSEFKNQEISMNINSKLINMTSSSNPIFYTLKNDFYRVFPRFDSWGKIYKRALFSEQGWPFVKFHANIIMTPYLYNRSVIKHVPIEFYLHTIRTNELLTHEIQNKISSNQIFVDHFKFLEFLKENSLELEIGVVLSLIEILHFLPRKYHNKYMQLLKKYRKHTLFTWFFMADFKHKYLYFLIRMNMFFCYKNYLRLHYFLKKRNERKKDIKKASKSNV